MLFIETAPETEFYFFSSNKEIERVLSVLRGEEKTHTGHMT